jgi:DNA-binding winged helix-turn-helix (wHTH) protein
MNSLPLISILKESNEIIIINRDKKVNVHVEHQIMQVLDLLLQHEGSIVDKKTFVDQVWKGNELVGGAALTKNIFKLRDLLKDNGISEVIQIETVPKKGYRLLNRPIERNIEPRNKKPTLWLFAGVLSISVSFAFFLFEKERTAHHVPPSVSIVGKDTIIQLGRKKEMIIENDSLSNKIISDSSANSQPSAAKENE